MSSHSLHVTLEPFSSASQTGSTPTFLTPSGNLAPIHTGGSGSGSGSGGMSASGLPHLQRESSLLKELGAVQWNTPLPSPTGGSSAMDTSGDGGSGSGAIKSEAGGSSSGSGGSKDGAKDSKEKDSHGPKDAKYLENFLSSISNMPEWVREKIGRIKGLERAMLVKSAALKEASQYHVSMIHAKLTPLKKADGDAAAMPPPSSSFSAASAAAAAGSAAPAASSSAAGASQSSMGAPLPPTGLSGLGSSFLGAGGAASGSGSGSAIDLTGKQRSGTSPSMGPSSSLLPPLPVPSPLSAPLPYTLTPAVVGPLPTENLLNNLTYLLVGPALHAQTMLQGHPALAGGAGPGGPGAPLALSRQEMGLMPMNLAPTAVAPVGKKLSAQTVSAQAHPFASIPSAPELASTAIAPLPIEPPSPHLSNEYLELRRRFPTAGEYDLDAAEKLMKEHQALLLDWAKQKAALVTELAEQIEALQKRAEASIKKFESKIRRGNFEVPATPIDRRRGPGAATAAAATASTAAASTTTAAANPPGSGGGDASRKRSYASLVQEMEAREIQYQLQHELRAEIEKQSASAMAAAHAQAAGGGAAAAGGAGTGAGASAGGGGAAAAGAAEASEPVYCICKKVSFGAMVACDNEDCPTEWFHFSCMGIEVKPTGKWFCPDCRVRNNKKRKAMTAKAKEKDKEKEKESEGGKEKEKEKSKK